MNDILYINGQIYTVDSSKSWAEAVAVKSGKITFVGTNDEAKSIEAKETVDLDGKMMLPGFIEAHGHVTWGAIDSLFKVSLFGADNVEFYIETIRKFVQKNPELPVYEGAGWENPFFGKNGPSRKVLDEICSDKPMLMWSHDKHSLWVNTYVLDLCGIDKNTQIPAGNVIEREDDGTPSGTLREFAAIALVDSVKPVFNKEHYKKAIEWVQKDFAQYGVTSIMDPLLDPEDDAIAAIRELNDEGRLICKMRGALKSSETDSYKHIDEFPKIREDVDSHMFKIQQVKLFADGVVEGKTAFLKQPYEGENYAGDPIWNKDDMNEFCRKVDELGFDIHVHSIGDAATSMTLDALDFINEKNPSRDRRPVITHLQIVDSADYSRIKQHKVAAVTNPYWHFKYRGFFEDIEVPYLGERAYHEYPMKSLLDAGIILGGASDYNVTPVPAPLRGIQIGVTRVGIDENPDDMDLVLAPEERLSVEQMVELFTMGNAYALRMEDITGSIEVGKCADLVILEENIFEVPHQDIYKVKVIQTVSEGKIIYKG